MTASFFYHLQTLLKDRAQEILEREQFNRSTLHLYAIGACWVAFEKSAYLLSCLYEDAYPSVVRQDSSASPIVIDGLTAEELPLVTQGRHLNQGDRSHLAIPISACNKAAFLKWRQELIEEVG